MYNPSKHKATSNSSDLRLRLAVLVFMFFGLAVIVRLVVLMIFQHGFYVAMAAGSHELFSKLNPKRGEIFIQDSRTKEEYPLAMNKDFFLVYADTRKIENDQKAEEITAKLAEIFKYDDEKKAQLLVSLNKRTDPYEPIEKKVEEKVVEEIKKLNLPGIEFIRSPYRYYPEKNLASNLVGFLGKDDKDNDIGRYGIEGYWQKELAGSGGFLSGSKGIGGSLVTLADWSMKPAQDGADILLTIDRTLQYQACEELRRAKEEYGAESATLIVLEPYSGAIRVMCSLPDFDPNIYRETKNSAAFNNTSIFTPYEPGSIFKPIIMAAALNEKVVDSGTTFFDSGARSEFCATPIKNAMDKSYGIQNMSGVLENSINTGMVFVTEKLGKEKFKDYVSKFGFGVKEGIELDTEVSGTIDSLTKNKSNKIDCYTATASFGQGITVTPLQMITAFGAIANGGKLMKPYIVDEVRYPDGKIERNKPKEIRQVLEKRTSLLLGGMLVNVVDKHTRSAQVKGYYIGGKTGTAQIPGPGGYSEETNHSFIGIAPIDDPKFVMLVKFEKPQRTWADGTAAPVFSKVADFILKYYQISPSK